MEQPQPRLPDTGNEIERLDYLAHSYPSSEHTIPSLAGWGIEPSRTPESMNQFQQFPMPMEWLEQVPATAPRTLGLNTADEQQYVPQAEDWHQVSTFGYVGFVESAWPRPSSVPWDPGALATTDNRQVAVDVTTLPLPVPTAYPSLQPEVESPVALFSTHWQDDDLDRQRPYQPQPTSGYNFGSEEGSGDDWAWGGSNRGRPPIQTKDLYSADQPLNQFASLLARRGSTSDLSSHTTSPSYSVAGLSFDAADVSYLSDTTTASFKQAHSRRRTNPTSPSAGDDHSDSHHDYTHNNNHPKHDSKYDAVNPLSPSPTQHQLQHPTQPQPQPQHQTQHQPPSQSQSQSQTQAQTTARNRNRAAASRYRAKTQAASARLESAARSAAARHRVLRARESRLRDEVVRLKHELLARHAQCDCEMIRGYLEGAVRGVLGGG